jgi:hypothetical protein
MASFYGGLTFKVVAVTSYWSETLASSTEEEVPNLMWNNSSTEVLIDVADWNAQTIAPNLESSLPNAITEQEKSMIMADDALDMFAPDSLELDLHLSREGAGMDWTTRE